MLVTTRKWYCDACGKEMKDYQSSRSIIEVDEDGYAHSVGYDFCLECTISFNDWIKSRKRIKE